MSIFRTYFYDDKGNELTDHPLNGLTWTRSPGYLSVNGAFKKNYRDGVTVAKYADMHSIVGEKFVTIADFPGRTKVGVKVWHGPNMEPDKFWLVAADHFEEKK